MANAGDSDLSGPADTGSGPSDSGARRITSALFLDFDNVYIGLQVLGQDVAEEFATDPGSWLQRLEAGRDRDGPFARRVLVRNCYLNPSRFAEYRAPFTRAGFRVIDCPSLTQQGKSAADVNLVLDLLDVLHGPLHYDEFFIMSADADFTPVAIRCREADRRVTIAAVGPAAAAYRAVADQVVLAEDLAGIADDDDSAAAVPPRMATTKKAASKAAAAGAAAKGAQPSKRPPAESVPSTAKKTGGARGQQKKASASSDAAVDAVLAFVRGAAGPVSAGAVAQAAQHADPELPKTRWGGAGSFAEWLTSRVPEVGYARTRSGFAWDPARAGVEDIPPLRQVQQITETPKLSRDQYAAVLQALAADVQAHPFRLADTARRVRDACQAAGLTIGRGSVSFVLKGILYAGFTFEGGPDVHVIAEHWADHVIGLARRARMELTEGDENVVRDWVGGGLV